MKQHNGHREYAAHAVEFAEMGRGNPPGINHGDGLKHYPLQITRHELRSRTPRPVTSHIAGTIFGLSMAESIGHKA
jgi:hypothetical protein